MSLENETPQEREARRARAFTLRENMTDLPIAEPSEIRARDFLDAIKGNGQYVYVADTLVLFEKLLSRARSQSFLAGRFQGLKEMDWAWMDATAGFALTNSNFRADFEPVKTLRSEYRQEFERLEYEAKAEYDAHE